MQKPPLTPGSCKSSSDLWLWLAGTPFHPGNPIQSFVSMHTNALMNETNLKKSTFRHSVKEELFIVYFYITKQEYFTKLVYKSEH